MEASCGFAVKFNLSGPSDQLFYCGMYGCAVMPNIITVAGKFF